MTRLYVEIPADFFTDPSSRERFLDEVLHRIDALAAGRSEARDPNEGEPEESTDDLWAADYRAKQQKASEHLMAIGDLLAAALNAADQRAQAGDRPWSVTEVTALSPWRDFVDEAELEGVILLDENVRIAVRWDRTGRCWLARDETLYEE